MWIAMELVQGTDLRTWFTNYSPMPLADVVPVIEQIAHVVQMAHRQGIVHRDLKPENIMVTPQEDGKLSPTLLDFGIARWLDDVSQASSPGPARTRDDDEPGASDRAVTSPGVVSTSKPTRPHRQGSTSTTPIARYSVGTREYRAPEMWADPKGAGPASDVYAFGVIAYEALAGRRPFDGATKEEWQEAHQLTPLEPIGDSTPDVFDAFRRALAKRPEDRPSPLEFAEALRKALAADPAEQVRTSAQLWQARGRSPDLLWGPSAIATGAPAATRPGRRSYKGVPRGESTARTGQQVEGDRGRAGCCGGWWSVPDVQERRAR
jgi:serine/threonine protein kinase